MISNTKIEIPKSIIDQTGAHSQGMKNQLPIKEEVTPVLEVHKFSFIVKSLSKATTGAGTIYTTPTDQDFYLTSATMVLTKNAACDSTYLYMGVKPDGEVTSIPLLILAGQTTTAESMQIANTYPYPIKLNRGQTIAIVPTFTAGAQTCYGTITGFLL